MTAAPVQHRKRVMRFFTAGEMKREIPTPKQLDPGNPKNPVVSEIVPTSAVLGDPDLTLVVHGSGFTDSSAVMFDGAPLVSTLRSANEISAVITPSAETTAHAVAVTVRTGRIRAKDPLTFTFTVPNGVPEGTTEEVIFWVNYNQTRAKMALDAEMTNDEPRDDLVAELQALIAAGS